MGEISHLPFCCVGVILGLFLSVLGTLWGPDFSISPLCLAVATQACLCFSPQTAADSGRSLMDPVYWS